MSTTYVHLVQDKAAKLALVIVGSHDAYDRIWAARNEFDSDVTLWLRTLPTQPPLADGSLVWPDAANRCRSYARLTAARLAAEGYEVLSLRRHDSYDGGKKSRRPCYCGRYGWFRGVREAARRIGLAHTTVMAHLNDPNKPDWRYDEVKK
jgi:hypothetical protein